jgi:histidinol-phosphate/aromatic aminotransferase/cobyric acid decarboxylase-like protein
MLQMIDEDKLTDLITVVARRANARQHMVLPFVDFCDFTTSLLSMLDDGDNDRRLIVNGPCPPDIALAADRAQIEPLEVTGDSPFSAEPIRITAEVRTGKEIVFLTNPNRVTGANFGLTDLENLASAVDQGYLIVDEHYFDFYGISAASLLDNLDNVIVLRSLTTPFGISWDESGFVIANPGMIDHLRDNYPWQRMSTTLYKILSTTLSNSEAMAMRLKVLHDESLRLTETLTKQGIQVRLSATDFLLLRVAHPDKVRASLTRFQVAVDILQGYDGLDNYVRYTLGSPGTNDLLLKGFGRMPKEHYTMKTIDSRILRLHRPAETSKADTAPTIERNTGSMTRKDIEPAGVK